MQSEVTEIDPVTVEVKVHVPWERIQQDLNTSYDRVAKTARLRGFRPGKVPRKVIRQVFGSKVKGDLAMALAEEGLIEAIQQHDIHPVARPDVDLPGIEEGQAWTFKAKVEVRPKIDKVDLSELTLYRPAAEVTDALVDEEVERLRQQQAELRVPEPMRPSKDGDQLTIDYQVLIDGEPKEDMGATDRPAELGSGRLIPEMEQGLQGVSPGETKDIEVTFAADHGREDLAGKTAILRVQVKELREKVLPEVDDEFAKDLGEFETLLELRLDIRKRLEQMAERRAEAELKEQALDRLVATNEVAAPPAMVRQQEQQMLYEFASLLHMSGQDAPMTEELHTRLHDRAERRVKSVILLGALARQEGLEVSDADVDARLDKIAEETGKHIAKVRAEHQDERRETLQNQLLEEKLMDFLLSKAQIKDGPPPEAPQEPKDEE
jgi:trigger factor